MFMPIMRNILIREATNDDKEPTISSIYLVIKNIYEAKVLGRTRTMIEN